MTPDKLTALSARLRDHAAMHESVIPHDDEQRQWRDDLLAAAEYLHQCAESEHAIVPQVWKMVPLEPTVEMRRAGTAANDGIVSDIYRAMIAAAPQPPSAQAAHPDNIAVDRFAAAMKAKLSKKRAEGREGWDDPSQCSVEFLARQLRDHIDKGDPVDVGNFAMMLFNRGERTNERFTQADAVEALWRIIEAANGRQRHNPITDEMHAALLYARAVLAAQGGGNAE